jgi:hypothetical protein
MDSELSGPHAAAVGLFGALQLHSQQGGRSQYYDETERLEFAIVGV